MKHLVIGLLACAATSGLSAGAHATTALYDFTLEGGTIKASGVLTCLVQYVFCNVSNISGQVIDTSLSSNTLTITGLNSNFDKVILNIGTPNVTPTFTGFAFYAGYVTINSVVGADYHLYNNHQAGAIYIENLYINNDPGVAVTFTTKLHDVAAAPEPATWAMFIFGFGGVGSALRRRSIKVVYS